MVTLTVMVTLTLTVTLTVMVTLSFILSPSLSPSLFLLFPLLSLPSSLFFSLLSPFFSQNLVPSILRPQALQSLSLADSRLRSRGTVLVNALGSNTCLRKVDLSGNNMEDIGAKMLSKALQINTTLRQEMRT